MKAEIRAFLHNLVEVLNNFLTGRTLFSKFWWSFFTLSLIGVAIYASLLSSKLSQYVALRSQLVHWQSAETINKYLFKDIEDKTQIQETLKLASSFYPAFSVYVYFPRTKELISTETNQQAVINTTPLIEFTTLKHAPVRPLYLNHPLFDHAAERDDHTFSTTKINVNNEEGYLIVLLFGKRYSELNLSKKEIPTILGILLFLSVIVISSMVALLVYLLILRRLKAVTSAITKCTSGDYSSQIIDKETDELSAHVHAFNTMANTIKELVEELRKQDNLRRELVANISHELRRPLTTLQLSIETLLESNHSNGNLENLKFLNQALNCSHELSDLIRDLFELSCLDASESLPEALVFDLKELCEDLVESFKLKYPTRNFCLQCSNNDSNYLVKADEVLIQRALSNLLENSFKYTNINDQIRLSLILEHNKIFISVFDTGVGIKDEDIPFVFERFYRSSQELTSSNTSSKVESGAGLGLAITKRIIELHGSKITLKSESGVCTEFMFNLDRHIK